MIKIIAVLCSLSSGKLPRADPSCRPFNRARPRTLREGSHAENEANAAHVANHRRLICPVELATQATHMNIDEVQEDPGKVCGVSGSSSFRCTLLQFPQEKVNVF